MFDSIDIVNTTQETLEFQKGARLVRLTPGLNTLGLHEWPFAQRKFGDKVRLAKDVPAKTYIDGPNAPVREPEPEPVNLDAAEQRDLDEHLADTTPAVPVEPVEPVEPVVPVEPVTEPPFDVPASQPDPEPVAHSLFTEPETLEAVPELPVTEPVVPETDAVPASAPLTQDTDKGA